MGWIVKDYRCNSCDEVYECLIAGENDMPDPCPACESADVSAMLSAPKPASYSLLSKDDQAKSLRKRSREHTLKQLKKDPTQMKMSRHVMKK